MDCSTTSAVLQSVSQAVSQEVVTYVNSSGRTSWIQRRIFGWQNLA